MPAERKRKESPVPILVTHMLDVSNFKKIENQKNVNESYTSTTKYSPKSAVDKPQFIRTTGNYGSY